MTIPHRPPLLTPATGHSPEAAGGLGFDLIQRILPIACLGLLLANCGPQGVSIPSIFTSLKPQTYTSSSMRVTSVGIPLRATPR